jgi:hypothetical protein
MRWNSTRYSEFSSEKEKGGAWDEAQRGYATHCHTLPRWEIGFG